MKRFLNSIFPSTAAAASPAGGSVSVSAGTHDDAAAAAGRACPQCSAAAAPDQDWCLECGSRIDATGSRWHQPVAITASIALIFVAGLALALSEVAKDPSIAGAKTIRKTVAALPPPAPATGTPDVPKPPKSSSVPSTSPNKTDTTTAPSTGSSSPNGTGSSSDPFGSSLTGTGSTGSTGSTSGGSVSSGGGSGSGTTTPVTVPEWTFDKKLSYTVIFDETLRQSGATLRR